MQHVYQRMMRNRICLVMVLGFIAMSKNGFAQSSSLGTWNNILIKKNVSEQWAVYGEYQLRSLSFYDRFYYYEAKLGVSCSLSQHWDLAIGGGIYESFNEGQEYDNVIKKQEARSWQQITFDHLLRGIQIEHRLRIEQRYKSTLEGRLVYRLNTKVPLRFFKANSSGFYINIYNEIYSDKSLMAAGQNRFFAGVEWLINPRIGLVLGWQHQTEYNKLANWDKNFILTSWSIKF